jgi:hypothetical protein
VAVTAKFTALVVLGPALVVPLLAERRQAARMAIAAVPASIAAWALVSLTYGLQGPHEGPWESAPFQALAPVAGPLLALFPGDFLSGVDAVLADDKRLTVNVVLNGVSVRHGIPSYFAWCAALKTPLALLAAVILGALLGIRRGQGATQALSVALVLALTAVYFSFFFRTQVGYRYVLMLVPLACLLAARGWTMALGPGRAAAIFAVVALVSLAETVRYREHPLAFTNVLVPDARDAFRFLADSNLDWGQDADAVASWVAAHDALRDPYHLLPGTNVFGASLVAGVWFPERYAHLRGGYRTPDEAPFFSHVAWRVDGPEFEAYLDAHRTLGDASRPTEPCAVADRTDRLPRSADWSLVCIDAPTGADLVLEPKSRTTVALAHATCDAAEPEMYAGHTAWFRVVPGAHRVCVRGGPVAFRVARGHASVGPAR